MSDEGGREEIASLGAAFELAAGELGFVAASSLFLDEVERLQGHEGLVSAMETLGAAYPVLHRVASRRLEGRREPAPDPRGVLAALAGVTRLLVVGIEAPHLDRLMAELPPDVRVGLLKYRLLPHDPERIAKNLPRVELVELSAFQAWAGTRAAILTFVYGLRGDQAHVMPAFLRVKGPDVRTQFREIIGWDVLGEPPDVYPRYLFEVDVEVFSHVEPHGGAR